MSTERGSVVEFDEERGLGVVVSTDGTRRSFHCTQIADGTRTIRVATAVVYDVAPGPLGVWEAVAIVPMPIDPPAR
jgi:cold shock CspA family protein